MAYIPSTGIHTTCNELLVALLKKKPEFLEKYAANLLAKGERPDVVEIIRNPRNVGDTFKNIVMR
jgi:hypothetical protein